MALFIMGAEGSGIRGAAARGLFYTRWAFIRPFFTTTKINADFVLRLIFMATDGSFHVRCGGFFFKGNVVW